MQAIAKYDAANTQQVKFKLNCTTDKDILDHLAKQPNKQGYFKELIRADIAAQTQRNILEDVIDSVQDLDPMAYGDGAGWVSEFKKDVIRVIRELQK